MTESAAVTEYWKAYVEEHPGAADLYDSAWAFGDNPRLADELLELVLKGIKTGTASNYALYEVRGQRLPFEGGHCVLLDGQGEPRAIMETVNVEIVPFDEVTAEFAYSEGEDDRSLESWRHEHEVYFKRECESLGRPFDPAMKVVCETFRVVHINERQ
ncbi:RNA-binding protein [Paenibacillus sp. PK3_47]|uniref:ASCH domain-containing protein n=1 Tax=Paenibacillus sp. PK3_47 TaxID=2072642 RepID=UPI00201E5476|nr:ASCH domain-containing protein [Paenibacillus sp. PK3_47]UQZ37586.1 RNA-binding protein [Paenibacillus sp. PK3_47]